jgi:hypothetical protein
LIEINASFFSFPIILVLEAKFWFDATAHCAFCCRPTAVALSFKAKEWERPPIIGNGLKNVSSGRARLQMTACVNNTPVWVEFGLSVLRGSSFRPT